MTKGKISLDPDELVLTSLGELMYKGKPLREHLGLSGPQRFTGSRNSSCLNDGVCGGTNVLCDNSKETTAAVNISLCSKG